MSQCSSLTPTATQPLRPCSKRRASVVQNRALVAFGMEHGKNHRLVIEDLVKHSMGEALQVGPTPVAEPDAVTEGIPSNDADDALNLIHEVRSEPRFLRVIPARLALDVRFSERVPAGRVH